MSKNLEKSDGMNSDFKVMFYEVIKKKKISEENLFLRVIHPAQHSTKKKKSNSFTSELGLSHNLLKWIQISAPSPPFFSRATHVVLLRPSRETGQWWHSGLGLHLRSPAGRMRWSVLALVLGHHRAAPVLLPGLSYMHSSLLLNARSNAFLRLLDILLHLNITLQTP